MAKSRYPFECSAAGLLQQAILAVQCDGWKPYGFHVTTEFRFHPQRKWRFDVAIIEPKVAIEYQGGIFRKKGAHNTVSAMKRDWEKFNEAQLLGWMVLMFGPDETRTGNAANVILRAIELTSPLQPLKLKNPLK